MRIVFFGTPALAVPFLEAAASRDEVVAVVSQPDQRAGRGLRLSPPAVKLRALELGLKVLQPERPSDVLQELRAAGPDLALTVAYGRLLKKELLDLPRFGCVNVHFSLLPKYRGAAPIAWCLARGEAETGVTTFWLDEGMDTGPILLQERFPIAPEDDALSLTPKLVALGVKVLAASLEVIRSGKAPRLPQSGEASQAPLLRKQDGLLRFSMPALEIHNRVRGMREWPRAYLEGCPAPGRDLQVFRTSCERWDRPEDPPGRILQAAKGRGLLVRCGSDAVWLKEVQPSGGKAMSGFDFANGLRLKPGQSLPFSSEPR